MGSAKLGEANPTGNVSGTFFIGTSGYNYPHWRGRFYPSGLPSKHWITYYADHFNSVELNVTFYRLPLTKTFEGWRERTPTGFSFSLKGSRFITHLKRLEGAADALGTFLERAAILGEKLSIVLWQLPPGLHADSVKLRNFLETLRSHPIGNRIRQAFEFRHKSWFEDETYALLSQYRCALCVADAPRWPRVKEATTEYVYVRFHGSERLYGSCYSPEDLEEWGDQIALWLTQGFDVYCYFNNDAEGYAINNARDLREIISQKTARNTSS